MASIHAPCHDRSPHFFAPKMLLQEGRSKDTDTEIAETLQKRDISRDDFQGDEFEDDSTSQEDDSPTVYLPPGSGTNDASNDSEEYEAQTYEDGNVGVDYDASADDHTWSDGYSELMVESDMSNDSEDYDDHFLEDPESLHDSSDLHNPDIDELPTEMVDDDAYDAHTEDYDDMQYQEDPGL